MKTTPADTIRTLQQIQRDLCNLQKPRPMFTPQEIDRMLERIFAEAPIQRVHIG
jgi:hypothetical protein